MYGLSIMKNVLANLGLSEEAINTIINLVSSLTSWASLCAINALSTERDNLIGVMVKLMHFQGLIGDGGLAPWRGKDYLYWYVVFGVRSKIAEWNEGSTLKVEHFQHWVWVYGVTPYNTSHDRVHFTGHNTYFGEEADIWPRMYQIGTQYIVTVPWRSGISYHNSIVIASTEMVWWWRQYDPSTGEENANHYDWGTLGLPTIFTRYYDGSP
ncbi:MAG: hypothetical protein QXJ27_04050, partial [Thermoplasmata archaeon]